MGICLLIHKTFFSDVILSNVYITDTHAVSYRVQFKTSANKIVAEADGDCIRCLVKVVISTAVIYSVHCMFV